ncbi:MAG: hypothetical protein QG673_1154 [Pseudomonadota bacterium]|nr:hypothetical protein [Pseudomonadota bacterium]
MDDDIKNIRKRNLRKIIDAKFKGSINAFAKHIDRPPGFFYDAFSDKRPLGERVMRTIEAKMGLAPYDLDRTETKKFELINVYPSKLFGKINLFDEDAIDQSPVNLGVILKNGWKRENLCCFDVQGDSMEPALRNGSRILIDTAQCEIIDNKIYALRNENQVFIKRLYTAFDQNKIIAKSDNQLYPELHIDLTDKNANVNIIGLAVLRLEEPL